MKVIIILSCFVLFVTGMSVVRPKPQVSDVAVEDLPLGTEVVDYDGNRFLKEGNIACWLSTDGYGPRGPTKKPMLSKPIYKYCFYAFRPRREGPSCSGWWSGDPVMEEYANTVFATNPNQTVVFITNRTNYGKTYMERFFLCNTSGCNIPVDLKSFLEFNVKQIPAPKFEFESKPTVAPTTWSFDNWSHQ